ncbi:septum formation inhibitor Maf [Candidatus Gribaldobacteria bacterium]|nr:septum formation inhibitor Maf [Candidatus Gribaldobacteria bacterium]
MQKIILASGSPRRKELLENIGLKFEVKKSDYEEDMGLALTSFELAKTLSSNKAQVVANNYPESIVIAADTFISLKNELLGKPKNEAEAKATLKKISGKCLVVLTGFTIINLAKNKKFSEVIETKVYIKNLSDKEIASYIATKEPLDKAGAFAIQGRGALFVEKIEGDFFNVIGLPLFSLSKALKDFGVNLLG